MKLATVIGLGLATTGVSAVWVGILAGSVAALIWARATRTAGPIPYGPCLLCGAWLAALILSIGP